jgi:hypothetical protein
MLTLSWLGAGAPAKAGPAKSPAALAAAAMILVKLVM